MLATKDSLIPRLQPRTEKLKPSRTRGDHGGTADLLMFLQLCCSVVKQHLLELLLLLQVKLSQLSREVVTHHLKIVFRISTVFAGLRRRGGTIVLKTFGKKTIQGRSRLYSVKFIEWEKGWNNDA